MQNIAIKTLKIFVTLQLLVLNTSCLDYSRNMVDGKLEPPEPGFFENDKTIGGIDSNNDGVRDDIERWINREFSGEEQYYLRQIYKQVAREHSMLLKPYQGKTQAYFYKVFKKSSRSAECGAFLFREVITGTNQTSNYKITKVILSKLLNNSLREAHYLKFQSHFHMMSDTLDPTSEQFKKCDFSLQKLP